MREHLRLYYRGEPLRDFEVSDRPILFGSGPDADVALHDEAVPPRALLLAVHGGTLMARSPVEGRAGWRPLAHGVRVDLGAYAVERLWEAAARPADRTPRTGPVEGLRERRVPRGLLVGRGGDARRIRLRTPVTSVGSAEHNDVVLRDRSVSRFHARFDLCREGLLVRDLSSTNGTWVNGVRLDRGRLEVGARLTLGRTDVLVLDDEGDANSDGLVVASRAMASALADVRRAAALPWPLLLLGPTGAGKERLAAVAHASGARARGPFVTVNAAAIAESLMESELFGHVRGAFTGAAADARGLFEQADGGTLFLDEVGELSPAVQARLLRVLESGEVRRVGGDSTRRVDVRVLAATHRDLLAMVGEGRFREDLYFRLARLVVRVPPLAERVEDVLPLAAHFLWEARAELGPRTLLPSAGPCLEAHPWPGNVRELRNVVLAAAAHTARAEIGAGDIREAMARVGVPRARREGSEVALLVERHGGNLSAAARALGVARSTLRDRMRMEGRRTRDSTPSVQERVPAHGGPAAVASAVPAPEGVPDGVARAADP